MRASMAFLATAVLLAGCVTSTAELGPASLPFELPTPEVVRSLVVDATRWSGEPSILAMADGTLLITGAGGMTRFVEDPTAAPGNFGQSYIWRSTDGGATWAFVDLGLPGQANALLPYRNAIMGVEGDLAEDEAGHAYFVDLTMLAANGVAVSDDAGASWTARQNPVVGLPAADRPWLAAMGDGHVWMKYLHLALGQRVAHSGDGGLTFLEDVELPDCGSAGLTADVASGHVLAPCVADGQVFLLRTGDGPMDWERIEVAQAEGDAGDSAADFPSVAVAGPGQYVVVWREGAEEGTLIRYAWSLDAGATWSAPTSVDATPATRVFPWADANAAGQIAIVWYEAATPGDPNTVDGVWYPKHASLVLAGGALSPPVVTDLSADPVHEGSICTSGLACVIEGRAKDRRLLDFFEVDVDAAGVSHVAWTSTMDVEPRVWYGQVTP